MQHLTKVKFMVKHIVFAKDSISNYLQILKKKLLGEITVKTNSRNIN